MMEVLRLFMEGLLALSSVAPEPRFLDGGKGVEENGGEPAGE